MRTGQAILSRWQQPVYRAVLLLLLCSSLSFAQDDRSVALVIHPDIRAPYSKVFDDIVVGFGEQFKGGAERLVISSGEGVSSIEEAVKLYQPSVVLALGKRSYDLYRASAAEQPVLLGATSQAQPEVAGVSMIPDAEVVLGSMLNFSPSVKKVYVVRRTGRLESILSVAEDYLKKHNVELDIRECENLQEGATAYRRVLDEANEGDAIWVLPGSTLLDNAVLSLALNRAWQKDLVMFSSNPLHVKRGLLFAVYPDNKGMGGSLGELANKTLTDGEQSGMMPLRDVLIAVNERTSRHLAIELTSEMKSNIDLLLPAR